MEQVLAHTPVAALRWLCQGGEDAPGLPGSLRNFRGGCGISDERGSDGVAQVSVRIDFQGSDEYRGVQRGAVAVVVHAPKNTPKVSAGRDVSVCGDGEC
mgnify:CR=1 FL=1